MIIERAGNAETLAALHRLFRLVEADKQLFPFGKQIGNLFAVQRFFFFVHVPARAAAAVIHRIRAFHKDFVDFAQVRAVFAFERANLVFALAQVKAAKFARRIAAQTLMIAGEQRDADGAGHVMMLRHDDRLADDVFKGRDNAAIGRHAALKENLFADAPVADHAVQIIFDDGIAQSGDEFVRFRALLLMIDEIGLHEHGAAFAEADRRFRAEREIAEFFLDVDAELFGLLFEERARSGGAGMIHLEIHDDGIINADIFGILPPDFENRVHFRVNMHGRPRLRRDFVAHGVRADEIAGQIAAGAGRGDAENFDAIGDFRADFFDAVPHGFNRASGGHQIPARQHVPVRVNHDDVRAD